jgi:hypothetical protein
VPISTRLLLTMVEIWARKDEPETADLRRVLHAARVLDEDPTSPTHLRAFAWRLVVETHRAAGWSLPAEVSLATCRAAADSISHACTLLITELTEEIRNVDGPVLLLGGLADSRSVFGRWDLVPAEGAVIVVLDGKFEGPPASGHLPPTRGVRWASPDQCRELCEEPAVAANLIGNEVLVPRPEMIAARIADRAPRPEDPAALVFCGAAFAAAARDSWTEVTSIAKRMGRPAAPAEAAATLGMDGYLGVKTGGLQKWVRSLRRVVRR